jgi:valyl-tRNA synthetase
VMISGWCLAADKTKMSKSKGNVVTPTALIIEKGADVVRYWASNSKLGVDIAYSEEVFKIGKKLLNKLWNASKFAAQHLSQLTGTPVSVKEDLAKGIITESLDIWIISKLSQAIVKATAKFEEFEYSDARVSLEDFFWNDFCDNYLEMIKHRVYQGSDSEKQSAIYTIYHVLHTLFRLFAPFMPHVCDELNAGIFGGDSVHKRGSWPKSEDFVCDEELIKQGENAKFVLELVRKYKSNNALSLRTSLKSITYYGVRLDDSTQKDIAAASHAEAISNSQEGSGSVNIENNPYTIEAEISDNGEI